MTASERQYGRDDVDYETWYSNWMKMLAKSHTRIEIEKMLGIQSNAAIVAVDQHHRAIKASTSMQSNSQRRAQSGNVLRAIGDHKIALGGALEIYDLFPEHTKEGQQSAAAN